MAWDLLMVISDTWAILERERERDRKGDSGRERRVSLRCPQARKVVKHNSPKIRLVHFLSAVRVSNLHIGV